MSDLPARPVTRTELLGLGWTGAAIAAALDSGDIRSVFRGVYAAATLPDSLELRCAAARRVVSVNHVVCDRSAALLHGVDVYGVRERAARDLEVCVVRGGTPSRVAGIDGRERDLLPRDICLLGGVRTTSPLRTALDLGCALTARRALGALDALARLHALECDVLLGEALRFRGRRGVIQLRSLIPLVDAGAESPRESWMRFDIHEAGLPRPVTQWWVVEGGVGVFCLDLAYPEERVAVEYDGEDFHRRTAEQIGRDHARREWLRARGWTLIVVTKEDLRRGPDAEWLARLRDALAPRTRRFRWEAHKG